MRCPRCNGRNVFINYDVNENDEWVKEVYCPECHYEDTLGITEEETLEDFAERQLQRIHNSVKMDIVNCFKTGKDYHEGLILDCDEQIVDVDIIIKRNDKWKKGHDEDFKICSECGNFETEYEETIVFGEYETLSRSYCNMGHDIDDTDANKCPDYY